MLVLPESPEACAISNNPSVISRLLPHEPQAVIRLICTKSGSSSVKQLSSNPARSKMRDANRVNPSGTFNAVLLEVAIERTRQIVAGYDHSEFDGQLMDAVVASVMKSDALPRIRGGQPRVWPRVGPVSHHDRREALVTAAAFLAAEIQRIDSAKRANG
jgi:hypothetical protein